jgi:hypothetical protein
MNDTVKLFKCLSDKSRMNILNLLMQRPMYVELISKSLNLAASTVSFHLKKLEQENLVTSKKEQYYSIYTINKDILNQSLLDLIKVDDIENIKQKQRQDDYKQKVLDSFFDNEGRLTAIPVQRKKRRVVLEKIAESFSRDRTYKEPEVNKIIMQFHYDFCTIRREFIMEKMFTREKGIYQKQE